jgi:molybdenum cofactor cytidylyltransferase
VRLAEALRLIPGRVVAFTGAGGKSTAIGRLAAELASQQPVIVTTTTHLGLDQTGLARAHLIASDQTSLDPLPGLLRTCRSVLVTGPAAPEEARWTGLGSAVLEAVCRIAAEAGATLLVEADGARGRSLKAPAAHEPVLPPNADVVVPVAGLDVIGAPLDNEMVHRPERVAALLGLGPGARVGVEHVARLLCHEEGGLKGVPASAEVRVLLNKAEGRGRVADGEEVARALLSSGRVASVLLGAVVKEDPVLESVGRVAGVVLAAGASRRLGVAKQTLAWQGRPLVWHAARAALEAGLSPVVVVTGAAAAEVRPALAEEPVRLVENAEWQSGQASSVRAGLAAVRGETEAVVFLLADTPFVDAPLVRALVAEHCRSLAPIVAPRVADRWANPVLFDRVAYPDLAQLEGDQGGRVLFDRFGVKGIEWDPAVLFDVDTPEDLRRLSETPRRPPRSAAGPGGVPRPQEDLGTESAGTGRQAVAAIVLAAGESRRMGRPKMTLSWPGGGTVIGQVARTFLGAGCQPVVVVTGGDRGAVEAALDRIPVHMVQNPRYAEGEMLSSIQAGLRSLLPGVEAALISPGDLPLLRMETIRRVVGAWERSGSPLVAPSFEGRRGHPVLVARSQWPALLALAEGQTLRDFLRARNTAIEHVTVDDPGIRTDLDTPDEYRRAKGSLS